MDTKVNYTVVGFFVISMVAAITLSIIWLSSGFSFEQYNTYAVYMQESVSGLSVDSNVEFNGVAVGSIKSIEIAPNNPKLVELLLSVKKQTPVTMATAATLGTKGLTGIAFITLKDDGSDSRPLVAKQGQRYPIIKTAPSLFMRLDQALSQVSGNLHKVTEDLGVLLNKENLDSLHHILTNLQRVTGTMAANSKQIDALLHNAANISGKLDPLLQSSANTMRILEVQTLPATYRLLSNLDATTKNLAEASAEIKQNPAIIVRGINRNNYGPGER